MTKTLIAIDPGKASGFVTLDITDFPSEDPVILRADELDQMETVHAVHVLFDKLLFPAQEAEVVMEDFRITIGTGKMNTKDTRFSLEIIGAVRYLCTLYEVPFKLQTPSDAKTFVNNDRIRALGLWVKGGAGHHKDAMRHAILYLVRERGWSTKKLLDG